MPVVLSIVNSGSLPVVAKCITNVPPPTDGSLDENKQSGNIEMVTIAAGASAQVKGDSIEFSEVTAVDNIPQSNSEGGSPGGA